MKLGYLKMGFLLVLLVVAAPVWAQVKKITGKVVAEEDGKSLAGVNIVVKNKNLGVQTDANGEFVIQAAPGDVLMVSYTGYGSQQLAVGGGSSLIISLKTEAGKLGEVVVVGYGTQIRKNLTSAVAKLDKDVLANSPRANVGTALQGTVSGLQVVNATGQPGANPVILLRGGASINNPGAPLTVVDGTIRAYNDIPAEDIESIELLKDAAATAIYGARANNGVILITTKRGRSGKAQVSYKYTGGYNKARDGYHFLGAKDYIYYNRLGNLNSGRTLAQVNSSRGYGLPTSAADLASFDIRPYNTTTAGLMSDGWDTVGDPYGGTIIFKNHGGEVQNLVFRNTHTQDHYLNVTGGNDKGTYFTSFDYYKEDGVIVGSGYKRFSGDINGSYKVRPNVEISSGVSMSTSSQLGVNGSEVNNMYRNLALWPTFNPWLDSAQTHPNPGNGINDGNPLYWLGKQKRSDEVNRITVNAAVKWDILPGLFIKATGSGYLCEQLDQSFTAATQTYQNIFANPPTYNTSRPSTSTWQRTWQQQYNAIANYTHSFGDHNLGAMVGAEYYDIKAFNMQVAGTLAPTDDISTVNASTTFAAGSNYTTTSDYRIISTFGRLNYDFDQKYLLSLVFRNDGVSSLASAHRYGFFPGMSAGWNVQKEKFFADAGIDHIVSTLKPRVSYGVNGNVAGLGYYEVQGTYALQGLYNGTAGFLNTGTINGDLRWEKSKTLDIGADIGFLHDRISVMFDYYKRNTSDLLTSLAVPDYTGFSSVRTNLGTFQNKGYELTINANILNEPNGLKWDVGVNASFVKNKILKLPYNGQPNNRQGGMQVYDPKSKQVVWVGGYQEGHTLGDIYAFKQVSIFKDDADIAKLAGNRVDVVAGISGPNATYGSGKITPGDVNWQDVDGNDTIDSRDQVYIGNIYPKWTGGFSTTLAYHGLSLYTRFEFATGHTIYNDYVARILGNYQGTFNYIDWMKRSWSPANTVTDIPKVYYADQVSAPLGKKNYTRSNNANGYLNSNNSRFYEKGNYLACREITLSYDLPMFWLHATRTLTRPARVYLSANNLFYITKFSGPSPEPPVSPGTGTISGIYQGTYPTPRSFVLGVQVSL
jgi:TonB-linked SusC/RagA family outer membrane protein